jgi:predicted amidophosphoribosyltransferase
MPYCTRCGMELFVDAKFCGNCGAAVQVAHKAPKAEWVAHRGVPIPKTGETFNLEREKHLCVLWSLYRDVEILRPLVNNAKFVCETCFRVAEKRENLCTPTPI